MPDVKHFDLNIDKILDNWDLSHAVRELIANAVDESMLTRTDPPTVFLDENGWWHIRDYGRGLRYQDLIQSENDEKLSHPLAIGKFGIGLKDALATFERQRARVLIRSRHGDIGLSRVTKHSFEDLVTLHAAVAQPSIPNLTGTDCCVFGVSAQDMHTAKAMFLCFAGTQPLESTRFGEVYQRSSEAAYIYINGMKVAEEPNFLFSYNITSLNASIKKALNRERQNLGRTAYSDRVRSILLASTNPAIAQWLAADLEGFSRGNAHDELGWLDVQQHAVRTLNASKRVLFVSPDQIVARPDLIDSARSSGYSVVAIPANLSEKIRGSSDVQGAPVADLHAFVRQQNESFQFVWVSPDQLLPQERSVWRYHGRILDLVGGRPAVVRDLRISETMCADPYAPDSAGLWDSANGRIIIKRSQLRSLPEFAGTLLHELLHAKYGVADVSRDFESRLTELAGSLASRLLA